MFSARGLAGMHNIRIVMLAVRMRGQRHCSPKRLADAQAADNFDAAGSRLEAPLQSKEGVRVQGLAPQLTFHHACCEGLAMHGLWHVGMHELL